MNKIIKLFIYSIFITLFSTKSDCQIIHYISKSKNKVEYKNLNSFLKNPTWIEKHIRIDIDWK